LDATVISRPIFVKILARLASCAPLRCMMFLNWECPAIIFYLMLSIDGFYCYFFACLRRKVKPLLHQKSTGLHRPEPCIQPFLGQKGFVVSSFGDFTPFQNDDAIHARNRGK